MDKEIWKDIEGYEGLYQVSNLGKVRSLVSHWGNKLLVPRIKKAALNSKGYERVGLSKNKRMIQIFVHRLVAIAFIPNPENKPCVNHIDGNHRNNCADNLEWCMQKENIKHAFDTKLAPSGTERKYVKLTKEQVECIRKEYVPHSKNFSISQLSKKYDVSNDLIYAIVHNKIYKDVKNFDIVNNEIVDKYDTTKRFTKELIEKIRNEYIYGSKTSGQRALAHKYNVSQATIWAILNNKTYK